MDLPVEANTKTINFLRTQFDELGLGATIRMTGATDGNIRIEIAHTREWSGQDAVSFLSDMNRLVLSMSEHLKKRKMGDIVERWAHESVIIAEAGARNASSTEGVLHGRVRGYDELISAGEDA